MTKKKTPTDSTFDKRPKKVAPKRKAVEPKGEWREYVHPAFPGNSVRVFNEESSIQPPAGETRVSELEAENYALKTLLSKHQSEPMPQTQNPLPQRATMLSQFAEQLDRQLSRLYNSLNTLDGLANKLLIQKEDGIQGKAPDAHDLSSRYSNILGYFSDQNDRLDFLTTKLSDLI